MLKKELIQSLKDIRSNLCAYMGGEHFCDCKYLMGLKKLSGEKSGCCELRMAIRLFEKMKAADFNKLLKAAGFRVVSHHKINPSAYVTSSKVNRASVKG